MSVFRFAGGMVPMINEQLAAPHGGRAPPEHKTLPDRHATGEIRIGPLLTPGSRLVAK